MAWVLRSIFALTLIVATVLLATGKHADSTLLGAAVVVGIAAAIQVYAALDARFHWKREAVDRNVTGALRQALLECIKSSDYPGDPTKLSLHVWEIPAWYRHMFPFPLRRALKHKFSLSVQQRRALRPKLRRVAADRIEPLPQLDIEYRKGIGLVGQCVADNEPDRIHVVNFDTSPYATALRDSTGWKTASPRLSRNLEYQDAQKLYERYGQAMAIVISTAAGEGIGCVTLEVPPETETQLQYCKGLAAILTKYASTFAGMLQ